MSEHLSIMNAASLAMRALERMPAYPDNREGQGIIICGGGIRYFTNAWICINILRELGCGLPVQLWYIDEAEYHEGMRELVLPLGVELVDSSKIVDSHFHPPRSGWQLKPFAILKCPFRDVLLLDADNIAVINPEFLFNTNEFAATGAIFWPDFGAFAPDRPVWKVFGVEYRDEREFESGQIVVDTKRCWEALWLTMWYNENASFYYQYVHGDKDTFHLAFRKLKKSYAMPTFPIAKIHGTMCQHDFNGTRIFQHRNGAKWSLFQRNHKIEGFQLESECFRYLGQLRERWNVKPKVPRFVKLRKSLAESLAAETIMGRFMRLEIENTGYKVLSFGPAGMVEIGLGGNEIFWDIVENPASKTTTLFLSSEDVVTSELEQRKDNTWRGPCHGYAQESVPSRLSTL